MLKSYSIHGLEGKHILLRASPAFADVLELAEVQPGEVEVFDLLPAEALADEEVLGRSLLHHAEADGVACRLFLGNEKFVGY